ncbi:MAG: phosphodiester glycosidase family protein [Mariniphaga sp.]
MSGLFRLAIRICILSFAMVLTIVAYSQNDSITLVTANWNTTKIAKGVVWKQYSFRGNLFGSNQNINILEVRQGRKRQFGVVDNGKILQPTSEFGRETGALAAVNGTFFNVKEGGSVDYIKVDGKVLHQNQLQNGKREFHQRSALAISGGKLRIEKWNDREDWESDLKAEDIMVSGPLLVTAHKPELLDSVSFNVTRHPRTAVALTSKKRVLLITIDGRNENAAGMSLFELRNIMRWLGSTDGINLDGGGSTTLWMNNQPENGVVNYPCDNKKWDHAGERKVANILSLKNN